MKSQKITKGFYQVTDYKTDSFYTVQKFDGRWLLQDVNDCIIEFFRTKKEAMKTVFMMIEAQYEYMKEIELENIKSDLDIINYYVDHIKSDEPKNNPVTNESKGDQMNNFKMLEQLKEFFIDLNKEEYAETLECVLVAYDLQSEILSGDLLESDLTIGYRAQLDHVISLFSRFIADNLMNHNASFKDCSEKILNVSLNY